MPAFPFAPHRHVAGHTVHSRGRGSAQIALSWHDARMPVRESYEFLAAEYDRGIRGGGHVESDVPGDGHRHASPGKGSCEDLGWVAHDQLERALSRDGRGRVSRRRAAELAWAGSPGLQRGRDGHGT